MDTFISDEVIQGLERAKERAIRKENKLCVHMGSNVYSVIRLWENGFALNAKTDPKLRGLVSVFDGSKMLYQCLIVCSAQEAGEVHYEFKRQTGTEYQPAVDFVLDRSKPIALLG